MFGINKLGVCFLFLRSPSISTLLHRCHLVIGGFLRHVVFHPLSLSFLALFLFGAIIRGGGGGAEGMQ